MSFFKKHTGLFRGFAAVFTALFLTAAITQAYATGKYQAKVDELLGTNSQAAEHSTDLADYRYKSDYDTVEELMKEEQSLNERISGEGSVLLKGNSDDIIVGGEQAVTLFGIRSFRMQYNGNIGAVTNESLQVRLDEALEEKGISVNTDMIECYREFLADYNTKDTTAVNEVPVSELEKKDIDYSDYKDAAVIVLGRTASEAATYYPGSEGISEQEEFSESPTGNILGLSDDERDLVDYVKKQGFDKVIVMLNTANTMEIEELKQDEAVDAIMLIGNPSAYGNYGVADILAGEVSPSGHLTDTYAVNTAAAPSAVNFGSYEYTNSEDTYSAWYQVEAEGIYVGYKYYETRYYDTVMGNGNAAEAAHGESYNGGDVWNYEDEVSYSFGYGVEGSEFDEEIISADIDWSGEEASSVTVRVTNTGDKACKHVVQLYVQAPYTEYDRENGIEKSAIQLVAYGKTGEASEKDFNDAVLLGAGESEDVTLTFNVSDFSSYDSRYSHDGTTGAYILEEGTYFFATGNGAHDAVNAVIREQDHTLLANTAVSGDVYTEKTDTSVAFTVGEDNETLIENQLEDMDFTYEAYEDAFTSKGAQHLSRNDWASTFPVEVTGVTANDYMLSYLNGSTYDAEEASGEYDGKVYTAADFGNPDETGEYTALDLAGITDYEDEMFENVLNEIPVSYYSAYVTGNNTSIPEILLEHGNAADSPCGIISGYGLYNDAREPFALDEGEDSLRGVAPSVYVGSPVMAATFSHLLAGEEGRMIGNDALWVGAYWWFGPGMNLHRSPYNGRNNEYYSEDAVLTGGMAADVTKACQEKGIVVCAKHFAFNDIEENRTGVGAFMTEQAARENELRGFEMAFRDGKMKSVMTGFNRAGVILTSAHDGLISGICRGEWGFDGLVITDSVKDKNYMIATDCLMAGTDFMLGGMGDATGAWENVSEENLLSDSVLTAKARESMHRYLYTFADSALLDGYDSSTSMGETVWWATALNLAKWITGGFAVLCVAGWTASVTLRRREKVHESASEK